jgi:hypothetical protein
MTTVPKGGARSNSAGAPQGISGIAAIARARRDAVGGDGQRLEFVGARAWFSRSTDGPVGGWVVERSFLIGWGAARCPVWEYRQIDLNDLPRKAAEVDVLNELGAQGWELVGIMDNHVAWECQIFCVRAFCEDGPPCAHPRTTSMKCTRPSSRAVILALDKSPCS